MGLAINTGAACGLASTRDYSEFLVEEFVVVLLLSPEHHRADERSHQGENAQKLLHSNLQEADFAVSP
ncbi:MAG: hypothetical protein IPG14_09285 [Dehalococcoidia bacterium]|nr:hypothetical protein [Dehalococcoidia bacterium]